MSQAMYGGSALRPYPKMSAKARPGAGGGREWVAAEKVHGAHFAVVCDGSGVRPAKRRELLSDELLDDFFGVARIWPGLAVGATRFAASLRAVWGETASVTVYGELAGGCYPHPDVPADPACEPVQTGVWYAPDLHWLVFDAAVETADGRCWIADRALRASAAEAGLRCVPVLGHGSAHSLGICRVCSRAWSRGCSGCRASRATSPRGMCSSRPGSGGRTMGPARWSR
ncbi:RNA ligase family protein [Embleya scabrispora]|nr:RNA ligase family protein [Embleya scabrispora]